MRFKLWVCVLIGSAFIPTARAQVDVWTNNVRGSYKWEDGSKWSLGVPPSFASVSAFITNNPSAGSGSPGRTVNIDATTAASFSSTMDINSLTISTPSTINRTTLLVSNTGSTPLLIRQNLEVLSRCTLSVTNAMLQVETYTDVEGTLTMADSTANISASEGNFALDIGAAPSSSGTVLLTGGLLDTFGSSVVGDSGTGQMSVSNATWLLGEIFVGHNFGSQGTLTVANGGSVSLSILDNGLFGTGTVWLTGGQIDAAGSGQITLGDNADGVGIMTVSNGTCQSHRMEIGRNGQGTVTFAGGLITVRDEFDLGEFAAATGTVWMTGGQLVVGSETFVGAAGVGQMTVSNGMWQAVNVYVAGTTGPPGTLSLAGGTNVFSSVLSIGSSEAATGVVWLTGGLLVVTNNSTFVADGEMTVSNGIWQAGAVEVGGFSTQGTLSVAGGTTLISSNLTIGLPGCSAGGIVSITGGELRVTNSTGTAVLDVESGTVMQSGGVLAIDRLVVTNTCGRFIHNGGTLILGSMVLDPNLDADRDGIPNGYEQAHGLDPLTPLDASADNDGDGFSNLQEYLAGTDPLNSGSALRILTVMRQGTDIRITWTSAGGKSNVVQATNGSGTGYATNFSDLVTFVLGGSGDVTNTYVDVGGATNTPSRFYRMRLAP